MERENREQGNLKNACIPIVMIISAFISLVLEIIIFSKFGSSLMQLPVYFVIYTISMLLYGYTMYSLVKLGQWSKKNAIIQSVLVAVFCLIFGLVPLLRAALEVIMGMQVIITSIVFSVIHILTLITKGRHNANSKQPN